MSQPPQEEPTGTGQEPPGGGWGAQPPQGRPQQPAPPLQPPSGASPGPYAPPPGQYAPGPYAPPPGQYAPPQGPYGQQPGGYGAPTGQPWPGYDGGVPGPGGPQGPGGGRSGRTLAITIGAGVLAVAALAVLLVLTLGGGDGGDTRADPAATTSQAPESTRPTTPSAAPSTTGSVTGSGQSLVGSLPIDFTDCAEAEPYGDGDIAAAVCGASTTQPGPEEAEFYLFDDVGTMESAFADDVAEQQTGPLPAGQDCSTAQGVVEWEAEGSPGGEVACLIIGNQVVVGWTDREHLIEGVVRAPGSTQADLAALVEWWRNNSDYQG